MVSILVSDTKGPGFDSHSLQILLLHFHLVPSFVQNKYPLHEQKNYVKTLIVLSFVQNELGLCLKI